MKLTHLLFTLMAFLVLVPGKAQKASVDIPYRFATRAEAQMLITDIDTYTNSWNQFDLNVRLQTQNGRKSQLLRLAMESTLNWSDADKEKLNKAFAKIEAAIKKQELNLPLPTEVILMKTSMAEESGAGAYTRENWIAIGEQVLNEATEEDLARLVAHELFHVLTRADLAFKKKTYETIGFTVLDHPIALPSDLVQKLISNPDVSRRDSYASFTIEGKSINCMMVTYTDVPYTEGTLFQYIKVGLVPLNEQFVPLQENGVTIIYSLEQASDFQSKIGKNTNYVIDPEEVLADNFSFLMIEKAGLPDPQIVENLKKVMQ
ncbi:hypothetical protein B5F91_13620 [Bacteroides sp. An322]|nr:hypothetical protein B5F91_13620 [Bacteroides sp. An322]